MRVLVCGGRDYTNKEKLYGVLNELFNNDTHLDDLVIISGMAPGADTLGAQWARDYWVRLLKFPAKWEELGKSAGAIRNQEMLDKGAPNMVIAFPGGKGTADMKARAKKAKIAVLEIYE